MGGATPPAPWQTVVSESGVCIYIYIYTHTPDYLINNAYIIYALLIKWIKMNMCKGRFCELF